MVTISLQKLHDETETLPPQVFLRAGVAVHLACALEHGYTEVYSNDQHLLAAAPRFGLVGRNAIP